MRAVSWIPEFTRQYNDNKNVSYLHIRKYDYSPLIPTLQSETILQYAK